MKLTMTGRNIEVTDALKSSTEEKLARLQNRHPNMDKMDLVFHVENITHVAEANVSVKGTDFHASAKDTDMYVAIDDLIHKLDVVLIKHKEKQKGR